MRPSSLPRLGLRREIAILLPTSLLLLAVVAIFTLFAYRHAVDRLIDLRRTEAARLARVLAADWRPAEGLAGLRRRAPLAVGCAVIADSGGVVAALGELPPVPPLAPIGGKRPLAAVAVGPDRALVGRVAGFAPRRGGGTVRVDLDAGTLHQLMRSQRILSGTVLTVCAATLLLVIAFVGHLLRPYEMLLARARQLGGGEAGEEDEDEVEFLIQTFDRAMSSLARGARPLAATTAASSDDDMAALGRTLAPSLESGLLLLDREGRVLALNPMGSELLGLRPQAPQLPLLAVLAPHPELAAFLTQAVETGRGVQRHEVELVRDGRERTLGLTIHPLRHGENVVRGFLVLFADLTEVQREAEEIRLADSLASLGELSAGVAHELRNSLGTLRGYLALLSRSALPPQATEYVDEMRRETAQVQRVVDDFLAFARPGTTRLEPVHLEHLVRRVAADPALAGSAIEVVVPAELAVDPPLIVGDEQLLTRALRNLVENAAQANRAARTDAQSAVAAVECRLALDEGDLELHVEDRGAGIPEELRSRVFLPFATGRAGGVGMGLALAHRIVDLHGGRLRLEDRPGGGTRATLSFPPDTFVTESDEPPAARPHGETDRRA